MKKQGSREPIACPAPRRARGLTLACLTLNPGQPSQGLQALATRGALVVTPPAPRPPLHSFQLPEILQKLQAISEKEPVVDWQPETLS